MSASTFIILAHRLLVKPLSVISLLIDRERRGQGLKKTTFPRIKGLGRPPYPTPASLTSHAQQLVPAVTLS